MHFHELLLERKIVSAADLERAREIQIRAGGRLPAILVRLGLAEEAQIAAALADAHGLALLQREAFPENLPRIDGVNPHFLQKRAVVPVARAGDHVRIAVADPEDLETIEAVVFAAGATAYTVEVASCTDVEEAAARHYSAAGEGVVEAADAALSDEDLERIAEGDSDAPVIRLVQRLLGNAVDRKASDVHIEPQARHIGVRYRLDGRLVEIERLPSELAGPIVSRIKILSGLDIAECRLPQDGRLRVTVRGVDVDVRVATTPIAHGESVVLRLLGRSTVPLDLDRLGLPAAALARFNAALAKPHGIILVTGPTGSGKTTTLYAAVNRLRRPDVKILTVEDPVEVVIDGVNQVQVRPEIDLTYAKTLRAFLRQDPDILMVGEIRDRETAEIALRAALTGHLVLSTLHTNSAMGAFPRLADIGIEPYLTASTVIASVAQRLIRTLCPNCRGTRPSSAAERELFHTLELAPPAALAEAVGCPACGHSGYAGRTPLIEVVTVDDALRSRIRGGLVEETGNCGGGAETLLGHGLSIVAEGRTSIEEVRRAVQLS